MEFSWTTFILEIINFLVLIWLLKRFFYQPVLSVINKRQQNIAQSLKQADTIKNEAEELKNQYTSRLSDWELEKQALREDLQVELNQIREKQMKSLDDELQKNQEKAAFLLKQESEHLKASISLKAIQDSAQFTRQLLQDISGPEQTDKLVQLMLKELEELPADHLKQLQTTWETLSTPVKIVSAHSLRTEVCQTIQQAILNKLGERDVQWNYLTDEALIGGIRVQIGPWILRASIQDELEFFRDIIHEQKV